LLANGLDVSILDKDGNTALHYAIMRGDEEMAHSLVKNNANALAKNSAGKTAVDAAVDYGHVNILEILLRSIPNQEGMERILTSFMLQDAVNEGDEENVIVLLKNGADPNALTARSVVPVFSGAFYSGDKVSLLHLAVLRMNTGVLQLLLSNGAIVDAKDRHGQTPLHWAACIDYPTGVRLLLDHGADIQAQAGVSRVTPLHMATKGASASAVQLLLERGAILEANTDTGETPLMWLLRAQGRGFNSSSHIHRALPLEHRAAAEQQEHKEAEERMAILDLLIANGANFNVRHRPREPAPALAVLNYEDLVSK
jgi:ankyrin repeat protein